MKILNANIEIRELMEEYMAIRAAVGHTLDKDHDNYDNRLTQGKYHGFDIAFNLLQKVYEEADTFYKQYKNLLNNDNKTLDICSLATNLRLIFEDLITFAYFFNYTLFEGDLELKVLIYEYQLLHTTRYLREFQIDDYSTLTKCQMDTAIEETKKKIREYLRIKLSADNNLRGLQELIQELIEDSQPFTKSFMLVDTIKLQERSLFNDHFKRFYTLLSSFSHGGAFAIGIYGNRKYEFPDSKIIKLFFEYLLSIYSNIFVEYKFYCKNNWNDPIELDCQFGPKELNMPEILTKWGKNIRKDKWPLDFVTT